MRQQAVGGKWDKKEGTAFIMCLSEVACVSSLRLLPASPDVISAHASTRCGMKSRFLSVSIQKPFRIHTPEQAIEL